MPSAPITRRPGTRLPVKSRAMIRPQDQVRVTAMAPQMPMSHIAR